MRLRTLHIRNFRHFDEVIIHDLADINVFAGANNAGKTSLLRAIRNTVSYVLGNTDGRREHLVLDFGVALNDCPGKQRNWDTDVQHRCAVGFPFSEWNIYPIRLEHNSALRVWGSVHDLPKLGIRKATGAVSPIEYGELPPLRDPFPFPEDDHRRGPVEYGIDRNELFPSLIGWLRRSFFLWHRRKSAYEDSPQKLESLDPDAVHIAARLSHLRNEKTREFPQRLEEFINAIIPGLGEPVIRWTADEKIRIMFGDRSLEELGGGVEHVLAIALILLGEPDDCGLFLEEPEAHLHPDAQHRLLEQLQKHRGNRQLFLTSHSPVFINGFPKEANIYHVTRDQETGPARVTLCVHRGHQRRVLDDLGVRPSSLLQTNCAIWIEGPTERVLLRFWLSLIDPDLQEHRHYEFLHTGGSLLAYLDADVDAASAEESAGGDTASGVDPSDIFQLCRNNIVICDRDAGPREPPAKPKVQELMKRVNGGGLNEHVTLWVTYAYEIEWYFPRQIVAESWGQDVADKLFRRRDKYRKPFYDQLAKTKGKGTPSAGDRKVESAQRVIAAAQRVDNALDVWFTGDVGADLRERLHEVRDVIRRANALPSHP